MSESSIKIGWITCFWFFFVWNVWYVPIAVYYLHIYMKHRDKPFFRARMSNATSMMVALTLLTMIQRTYDGFIGVGYIRDTYDPIANSLISFIQFQPIFAFYLYKYVIQLYYRFNL